MREREKERRLRDQTTQDYTKTTKAIEDRRERERARGERREIGEKCIESREIR